MRAAISFFVRDANAWLLDRGVKMVNVHSCHEDEALALEEAVRFAVKNELESVTFEYDNNTPVQ